jgi:amino acid transporter
MAVSEAALADATDGPTAGRLHKQLSTFECLLLTLSCLSPVVSIFGIGSDVLQHAGSGAALLFLGGIAIAVLWAVVYAELGSAFPYAGGDYVGIGTVLGPWAGAVTLACWAAIIGPQNAFQTETIALYVKDVFPGASDGPVTAVALVGEVAIALLAVRAGALVTGVFLAIELIAVLVLIGAGIAHPPHGLARAFSAPVTSGHGGGFIAPSMTVLALAGVNAAYATVGGNQAIYFGEELIDPHRRMGRVILIACLSGAVMIALPVILVVVSAPDFAAVLRSSAPMSAFVAQTLSPAAGKALSVSIALAVFNATIVNIMMGARLFFSLGRDQVFARPLNTLLARVAPTSGVPRIATLVVGVYTAACCFLSAHALLVFISGLLVYGWGLVCLTVLKGRLRGKTGGPGFWRAPFGVLAPVLGLVLTVMFAAADIADPDAGRPSLILLGVIAVAAALWSRFVLEKRPGGWTPTLIGQD